MKAKTADNYISALHLQPHPEGGYFREVYRSGDILPPETMPGRYQGERNMATSIYYLLKQGEISRLHVLDSDETWVMIDGSPVEMHLFTPQQQYRKIVVGINVISGAYPQLTIPRQTHLPLPLNGESTFSLVACIVTPGFSFNDFHFSDKKELTRRFPDQKQIIAAF
ncbi:MAG: cupin domain-containing protein [Bacteroidales bacterium]|nr:cupin domain-containing protein [Bacteroidales bacterium]